MKKNNLLLVIYLIILIKIKYTSSILFIAKSSLNSNNQKDFESESEYAFVSCFFPIKKGKIRHTILDYQIKASRLLNSFSNTLPLFIYTTTEGKSMLEKAKKLNSSLPITPNVKFITNYQSVYDIPRISQYKKQYEDISKTMVRYFKRKGRRKNISAEIGAIWNSKIVFLNEIIEKYETTFKFVFWIDIGIIKTDEYFHKNETFIWPSVERIKKIFQKDKFKQRMLFWICPGNVKNAKSLDEINLKNYDVFIHAAFFGGSLKSFKKFIPEYWKIHDNLIKKKQFVLREEMVMSAYAVLNINDVFLFNMKASKCYFYHSCVGFISKYNLCKYPNNVITLVPKKINMLFSNESLGDWL